MQKQENKYEFFFVLNNIWRLCKNSFLMPSLIHQDYFILISFSFSFASVHVLGIHYIKKKTNRMKFFNVVAFSNIIYV